jgi:hypothetical protein
MPEIILSRAEVGISGLCPSIEPGTYGHHQARVSTYTSSDIHEGPGSRLEVFLEALRRQ